MKLRRFVFCCVLAAISVCVGCNSGDWRSAVSGVVTSDGEPVPMGIVQFTPENPDPTKGVVAGSAQIVDGKYEIPAKDVGLMPGKYKVTVIANVSRLKSTGEIVSAEDVKDGVVSPFDVETENMAPPKFGSESEQYVEIGKVKKTVYDINMTSEE